MTKIAEVRFNCGRYFLVVAKVVIALEGDPCRDTNYPENRWDLNSLKDAAKKINEAANK
jgi:hypothetical protein